MRYKYKRKRFNERRKERSQGVPLFLDESCQKPLHSGFLVISSYNPPGYDESKCFLIHTRKKARRNHPQFFQDDANSPFPASNRYKNTIFGIRAFSLLILVWFNQLDLVATFGCFMYTQHQ